MHQVGDKSVPALMASEKTNQVRYSLINRTGAVKIFRRKVTAVP